jgi:hypothetical protein
VTKSTLNKIDIRQVLAPEGWQPVFSVD